MNAVGNFIPPHFVFPRKIFKSHFLNGSPVGSVGTANGSGWMQDDDFLFYMKHFVEYSGASPSNKTLLILDNHSSHISLPVIDFCKENGITLLSFPPHCSHKLQPLDRAVYGPFKRQINYHSDQWMKKNPGKTMTIYDIPGVVNQAIPFSMTSINIHAGFKSTGIHPFNRDVFRESEFSPSFITDRPNLCSTTDLSENSNFPISSGNGSNSNNSLCLENIQPFPKVRGRTQTSRGRKRRISEILTQSPSRNEIAREKRATNKHQVKNPHNKV